MNDVMRALHAVKRTREFIEDDKVNALGIDNLDLVVAHAYRRSAVAHLDLAVTNLLLLEAELNKELLENYND